jgi:hypothetical protein
VLRKKEIIQKKRWPRWSAKLLNSLSSYGQGIHSRCQFRGETYIKNEELFYLSVKACPGVGHLQASFIHLSTAETSFAIHKRHLFLGETANQASLEGTLKICRAFASLSILTKLASKPSHSTACNLEKLPRDE